MSKETVLVNGVPTPVYVLDRAKEPVVGQDDVVILVIPGNPGMTCEDIDMCFGSFRLSI